MVAPQETEPVHINIAQRVKRWLTRVSLEGIDTFGPNGDVTYSQAAKTILFALENGDIFMRLRSGAAGNPITAVVEKRPVRKEVRDIETFTFKGYRAGEVQVVILEIDPDCSNASFSRYGLLALATLYTRHIGMPTRVIEGDAAVLVRFTVSESDGAEKLPYGLLRFPILK